VTQAAARILAATLTLLSREQRRLPPPFSLWTEALEPADIMAAARAVADDQAEALWVDDAHPARGLLLMRPQPLEAAILGTPSLRLQGPYLVEPDPAERARCSSILAAKAVESAEAQGAAFLSLKTAQDPAVLRGFLEKGFRLAELTARLAGPLKAAGLPEFPFQRGFGLSLERPELDDSAWLDELGPLFYDGHLLHGPFLSPSFQPKLWRAVAAREIAAGAPALRLTEDRSGRPVGLALVTLRESAAELTVLHVAEGRRGEGLGRLLLAEIVRAALSLGAKTLQAETAAWNLPALALYLGLGLKPTAPAAALHYAFEQRRLNGVWPAPPWRPPRGPS
jgi:GNAT superfamily N-acetyltransferase